MDAEKIARDHLVFECLAGSHSYGTASAHSDIDKRGICIAPPEVTLSRFKNMEQYEDPTCDRVIYEIGKFFDLAAQCNPNIIELLYTPPENILMCAPEFHLVRQHGHLFLSRKAKHTFSGYAMSQLKRIEGHHKWIMNPQPEAPPLLASYCTYMSKEGAVTRGVDSGPVSGADIIRALSKGLFLVRTFGRTTYRVFANRSGNFAPGFFNPDETDLSYIDVEEERLWKHSIEFRGILMVNFDEFRHARTDWKDYWTWKRNRNEARAKLEAQFGFDTKHAMHLVRLMRMAKEILTEGKVIVRRPDAEDLLRIRNGEFDYDWLMKWAADTDAELTAMYESSPLPHGADQEGIDRLYWQVLFGYWSRCGLNCQPALLEQSHGRC
jgi:predicted nucleotidyltransferase